MMDTSLEYLKMCDNPDIQGLKPELNPYDKNEWKFVGQVEFYKDNYAGYKGRYVWLPRQDQLQEMFEANNDTFSNIILDKLADLMTWLCRSEYWDGGFDNSYAEHFVSMEQLWLAFVMKEKYQKVWNGDDWIPSK